MIFKSNDGKIVINVQNQELSEEQIKIIFDIMALINQQIINLNIKQIKDLFEMFVFPLFPENCKTKAQILEVLEKAEAHEIEEKQIPAGDEAYKYRYIGHNFFIIKQLSDILQIEDFDILNIESYNSTQVENFVKQVYRKPAKLEMSNTKLTNCLFDPDNIEKFVEGTPINVASPKKPKLFITANIVYSDPNLDKLGINKILTPFDCAVYDGICSIIAQPQNKLLATPNQIYEAFSGKPTKSKQVIQNIVKSVEKLRSITINFDCTEHAKKKDPHIETYIVNENLLMCRGHRFSSCGTVTVGYQFLKMPCLYEYAKAVKQIIAVDRSLFDVGIDRYTDDSILIVRFLLRRIEAMKNTHNSVKGRKIAYDSIFKASNISLEMTKSERKRKRTMIEKILYSWQERGYIKGFQEYMSGKTYAGIEINI